LLILDEPTAALNDEESNKLLLLLLELKKQGVTSILISHKLEEIARVSDSITIIRDGRVIETLDNESHQIDQDRIIKSMVGREIVDRFPKRSSRVGEVVFQVEDWNVYHPQFEDRQVISNVSLNLRRGEVIGLAGLMGAGRTELAMSLFGRSYGKRHSGKIFKEGVELHLHSVSESIGHGIAYLTEDRKNFGLVIIEDIMSNITLASLPKVSKGQVINRGIENQTATDMQQQMRIRCTGIDQVVESLSGGNQQKVVLSKWIMASPDILILDEPTRGIDVGAKSEIHRLITGLAAEGVAILMISSELPEVLGMSDRIMVMHEGHVSGFLDRSEADQVKIMDLAAR
ncbi:MAG TPA: ABC transporter ATP-binding protein, partial [Gemmobacter sp.]|nr:ABC transporter ATP-binding protein [Gemmobacter sp.]